MRIKREIVITWEMSENDAKILDNHNCKGIEAHKNVVAKALDALQAVIPDDTRFGL